MICLGFISILRSSKIGQVFPDEGRKNVLNGLQFHKRVVKGFKGIAFGLRLIVSRFCNDERGQVGNVDFVLLNEAVEQSPMLFRADLRQGLGQQRGKPRSQSL